MLSYQSLLEYILEFGEDHEDRTGVGTKSVFGFQWRHAFVDGFPLLTTKKVFFRGVAEELFWFLSGSTNVKDLQEKNVHIWDSWSTKEQCARFGREEGDLGPVYGKLWRDFGGSRGKDGVDQIRNLVEEIQANPNSRRLIVSGWHPLLKDRVSLPPCHTLFQIKCHNNREMSLSLYARSIDSFLGLPFNIASYGLLLELLAHVTGYTPRMLVISFGDLHIYKNHLDVARQQMEREPFPLPDLKISDRLRNGGFDALIDCKYEDLELVGYKHHGKLEAEVAV